MCRRCPRNLSYWNVNLRIIIQCSMTWTWNQIIYSSLVESMWISRNRPPLTTFSPPLSILMLKVKFALKRREIRCGESDTWRGRRRAAEVTFIMLTNANVNRNDRRARTEEYSRKVRTVVSARSVLREDRLSVCGSPRTQRGKFYPREEIATAREDEREGRGGGKEFPRRRSVAR